MAAEIFFNPKIEHYIVAGIGTSQISTASYTVRHSSNKHVAESPSIPCPHRPCAK